MEDKNAYSFKDSEVSRCMLRKLERYLSLVPERIFCNGPINLLGYWEMGALEPSLGAFPTQKSCNGHLEIFETLPLSDDSKSVSGKFWPTLTLPEIFLVPSILNLQYHKTEVFMGCLILRPFVYILQQILFKEEFVKYIMHVCIFLSCTNWSLEFTIKCSNAKS